MGIRWAQVLTVFAGMLLSAMDAAAITSAASAPREASVGGYRHLVLETAGAKPDDVLPMIVGLHYSGATPEAILEYFDAIGFPARVVLPQGRHVRRDGYSWFPSDYVERDASEQDDAVFREEDALSAFIQSVVQAYPTRGKPAVMGVSYGGDLSVLLATRHPGQFSAAFPVAARLLPTWMPAGNACKPDCPPIYFMHGDQDTTVPMAPTRHAAQLLRDLGLPVEFQVYPGAAHDFDARMKHDFSVRVASIFSAQLSTPAQ